MAFLVGLWKAKENKYRHVLAPRLIAMFSAVPELAETRQFCAARRTPYLTPSTTLLPLSNTPPCLLPVQRRSSATSTSFYQLVYSPSLAENYNSCLLAHNDVIIDHGPHPRRRNSLEIDKCNEAHPYRTVYCLLYSTAHDPNVVFCMTLEFQQIFFTLYVTACKLIRHVPPLAPLREFLDDDDIGPELMAGGKKAIICEIRVHILEHMPNNVIALMADVGGCGGSRA
jgi:hypothetical protein